MAERLLTFDFTKPSALTKADKAIYPWDEWLDGDIWKLTEGVDFLTHPLMMERIIRTRATTRRAKVQLRHQPGGGSESFGVLVLQRTDVPRPERSSVASDADTALVDIDVPATTAMTDEVVDNSAPFSAAGAPRCPVCTSWEVNRHVEGFRVWFTCRRCGAVFGQ